MVGPHTDARGGMTLAVVVVLLLALQAMAHGVLVGAMRELEAARVGRAMVQARFAAEGAVNRIAGKLRIDPSELLVGASRSVEVAESGGTTVRILEERVSREGWLIEGAATVTGWPGQVRRARLVWIMDPLARVGSVPGVVTTAAGAPAHIHGSLQATVLPPDGEIPSSCAPWGEGLRAFFPGPGTLPPVFAADRPSPRPRLGLLTADDLLGLAIAVSADTVTPEPSYSRGGCAVTDPDNWGGRTDGRTTCLAHFVLRARDGDLVMRGGVAQGVLVVTGNAVLEAGASFRGMVLAGGSLVLRQGARVEGFVEASGGAVIEAGAEVVGSACAAVEALDAVRGALSLPLPHPALPRDWVGPLPARREPPRGG